MKRSISILVCIVLLITMIPGGACASEATRELVLLPWYWVESVEDDGVTLNLEDWVDDSISSGLTIEIIHRLVVAERITKDGQVTYKAVSGAVCTSNKLKLTEAMRSEPLSLGRYKLLDYALDPETLGTYTIEYAGMTAEVEIILPVLGYYSKPEAKFENWLPNRFVYDNSKENIFYIIIPEDEAKYITEFCIGDEYTEKACSLEPVEGYTHGYKVAVHEPGGYLYFYFSGTQGGKGECIHIIEKPDRVILRSPSTSSKHSVTVKWKKQKCDGYQVQIATNSKFTKGVKTYRIKNDETLKKTVKSLKKGKKYYMRVRAYENVGEYIYGRWSKYKAITCK